MSIPGTHGCMTSRGVIQRSENCPSRSRFATLVSPLHLGIDAEECEKHNGYEDC
jgi:hypothetical protein